MPVASNPALIKCLVSFPHPQKIPNALKTTHSSSSEPSGEKVVELEWESELSEKLSSSRSVRSVSLGSTKVASGAKVTLLLEASCPRIEPLGGRKAERKEPGQTFTLPGTCVSTERSFADPKLCCAVRISRIPKPSSNKSSAAELLALRPRASIEH